MHSRTTLRELGVRRRPLRSSLKISIQSLSTIVSLQVEVDHDVIVRHTYEVFAMYVDVGQHRTDHLTWFRSLHYVIDQSFVISPVSLWTPICFTVLRRLVREQHVQQRR